MINSRKKGFTLVELVIVIAVVAILAAVLIPTFSSLIKKANTANDTVVAKNMNTALAEYTALNGKPENFEEVLEAIEEAGYVLANLNAKAEGNLYGWDEKNNQIVYIDKDGNTIYQNVDFVKDNVKFVVSYATNAPSWVNKDTIVDMSKPEGPKALVGALEAGISVTLSDNSEITRTINIPESAIVVLDLAGKTLSVGEPESTSGRSDYAIDNYGTITIKNGTIKGRGIENFGTMTIEDTATIEAVDSNGGASVWNEGELTINGGTFLAQRGEMQGGNPKGSTALYNNGGTVVVNGGTFKGNDYAYAICNDKNGTMTINNCTVTTGRGAIGSYSGTVVVNGGTFTAEGKNGAHGFYIPKGTFKIGASVSLTYTGTGQEIYKTSDATVEDAR